MAERKVLSKKTRFEVFKRDKFTCQYCGRMSPDVILEVDHIKPVAKGGDNNMLNLITSCKDCNRGKRDIPLSDDSAVKKQQVQLLELAERKEQLEMMLDWRKALSELDNEYVNAVDDVFATWTNWRLSERGKRIVLKWLKEFSLNEILDAAEIAIKTYYKDTEESFATAFNKVSGICHIKRIQKDNPKIYYYNYTVKALKNKGIRFDRSNISALIENAIYDESDFLILKDVLGDSDSWFKFKNFCKELFNYEFGG